MLRRAIHRTPRQHTYSIYLLNFMWGIESTIRKPEELGGLDVVFSDAYPIARGVETGGSGNHLGNPSPTSIRNHTWFSEKRHVKITTLFKISETSNEICDILKHALATYPWQCRGSGVLHTRRTTILDFTDAKRYCSKKGNKLQQFLCKPTLRSSKFWRGADIIRAFPAMRFCLVRSPTFPIGKRNMQKLCQRLQFSGLSLCVLWVHRRYSLVKSRFLTSYGC